MEPIIVPRKLTIPIIQPATRAQPIFQIKPIKPLFQIGPTVSQIGPIVSQIGPTVSQIGPTVSQIGPTVSQIGPTVSQPISQVKPIFQIGPTVSQIGPTVSQIGPTVSQIGPTVSQIGPTVSQIGPIEPGPVEEITELNLPLTLPVEPTQPIRQLVPQISTVQPEIKEEEKDVIELDDLVYSYPDVKDHDFQGKIGRKLEFAELITGGKEPIPKRGDFFSHQIFVHRFLQIYDRVLLIHPTGSGKSCSAGGSSERFKANFFRGVIDYAEQYLSGTRNQIKRVYILVPGPVIKEEFKNQITKNCSKLGEYYDSQYVREATNELSARKRVNKLFKSFYSIMTYGAFAKEVDTNTRLSEGLTAQSTEAIIRIYSGSMFIIDEGNNLILSGEEELGIAEKRVARELRRAERAISGEEVRYNDKLFIYDLIQPVFKLAKRSKVVILAATPMINDPRDLTYVMNLLIPAGEPEMDPTEDIIDMPDEKLRNFFRGRISYVPDLDTNVDVEYIGDPLQTVLQKIDPQGILFKNKYYPYESTIYLSEMLISPQPQIELWQDDGYRRAKLSPSKWRWDERQASNFVYPDGSYGKYGFGKEKTIPSGPEQSQRLFESAYIIKENRRYRARPALAGWLLTNEVNPAQDYLRYRSSKYAKIIPLLKQNQGKIFCYSDFLTGSGIIVFGLALEANGFDRFDRSETVFTSQKIEELTVLSIRDAQGRRIAREMTIEPKLRYAMLTGEMNIKERNSILTLFNSWENRHGDFIKVLVTSPVGQFGLNVNDVTMIHILEGGWHEAGHYQALSRSLRATSHVFLLEEEQDHLYPSILARLQAQGQSLEQAEIEAKAEVKRLARITVKIYQHAAYSQSTGDSVDIRLYRTSEQKAIRIDFVFQKLKTNSVDCLVHRFRQIRTGTKSRIEYFGSQYPCLTDTIEPIEVSSYDVLYSEPNVIRAMNFLKEIFAQHFSYKLDQLYGKFKELGQEKSAQRDPRLPDFFPYYYRAKFILMAAEQIISHKIPLTDRFGFTSYLRESNGFLYLTSDYPVTNHPSKLSSTYYLENLIGYIQRDMDEYLNLVQRSSQSSLIDQIKTMQDQSEILSLLNSLSNTSQVDLLEWAVIDSIQPPENQTNPIASEIILKRFNFNLYPGRDPQFLVDQVENKVRSREIIGKRPRGRPPKPGAQPRITFPDQDFDRLESSNAGRIFFHNLAGQDKDETAYRITAQYQTGQGQIRLYKLSEGQWRDLTASEKLVYNDYIKYQHKNLKLKPFEQYKLYGDISSIDGKFRVHNLITFELEGITDRRKIPRGKVCTSYKTSDLIYFLYYEGAVSPVSTEGINVDQAKTYIRTKITDRDQLIQQVLNDPNIDPQEIVLIYGWYRYLAQIGEKQKIPLCRELQKVFNQKNKLNNPSGKFASM